MRFGQTSLIEAENIQLSLGQVIQDSRCPSNVNCAWSGELVVNLNLIKDGKPLTSLVLSSQDARRNQAKPTFQDYNVALLGATPVPYYTDYGSAKAELKPIKLEDYVLELLVTKVENGIVPSDQAVLERRVQLNYGQTARYAAQGLSLKFAALTEEQRCPKSSNGVFMACSTSGKASIALTATKTGLNQPQTVSLTIPGLVEDTSNLNSQAVTPEYTATFEGYKIQLISLQSYPLASEKRGATAPELYIATLVVTKQS